MPTSVQTTYVRGLSVLLIRTTDTDIQSDIFKSKGTLSKWKRARAAWQKAYDENEKMADMTRIRATEYVLGCLTTLHD